MVDSNGNEIKQKKRRGRKRKQEVHLSKIGKNDKMYKCEKCSKSWNIYNNYINHMTSAHEGVNDEKKFQCKICGKNYAWNRMLQKHIAVVHEGKGQFYSENKKSIEAKPEKQTKRFFISFYALGLFRLKMDKFERVQILMKAMQLFLVFQNFLLFLPRAFH